jgi:D-tyrosyl-tRNA(Tyr) deacylase
MRAVLQRVSSANVNVNGDSLSQIERGWLVLLGVGQQDNPEDARYLAEKTAQIRAFTDENAKMNLSVVDIKGSVLVVSQFTLYADCRKGRRPGFSSAAPPDQAERLYHTFVEHLRGHGLDVKTGQFQAHMEVSLVNDGPVTLLLDSHKAF